MRSEKSIQDSILKYLRKTYPTAVVWKLHEDPVFGVVGIPDILFIHNGRTHFFEVKNEKGRLSKIQKTVLMKLNKNKVCAVNVKSVDEVKEIICLYGLSS